MKIIVTSPDVNHIRMTGERIELGHFEQKWPGEEYAQVCLSEHHFGWVKVADLSAAIEW